MPSWQGREGSRFEVFLITIFNYHSKRERKKKKKEMTGLHLCPCFFNTPNMSLTGALSSSCSLFFFGFIIQSLRYKRFGEKEQPWWRRAEWCWKNSHEQYENLVTYFYKSNMCDNAHIACVCVCVRECAHVCLCMWWPEADIGCFLQLLPPLCLIQHWKQNKPTQSR